MTGVGAQDASRRAGWSVGRLAVLAVLVVLAVLAALPSWQNVATLALRSAESSHMLIVPVVFALLLWQRRAALARTAPRWSLWGPALALLGVALDLTGFAGQADVAKDLGMLVMLLAAVVAVAGPRWVLSAPAAFAVLLFLVPVPGRVRQRIALPLQEVSAEITQWVLELLGQPVQRLGNVLQINGVDVAVAEACNGMRMVVALALVAYAFAFSVPMRPWARLALLAISPLIAIAANVLRLGPTTLFYGYADPAVADLFHDVSGWAVLVVALAGMGGLLALARWLELPIDPTPAPTPTSTATTTGGSAHAGPQPRPSREPSRGGQRYHQGPNQPDQPDSPDQPSGAPDRSGPVPGGSAPGGSEGDQRA